MRIIAILLIAASLGAAEMRQLGPTEDLPYCRVTTQDSDNGRQFQTAHDGWYCAQTRMLYPLNAKGGLFIGGPISPDTIVSVQPASRQPCAMPAEWRNHLNDYIAKHHPQVADNDPMAIKR